MTTVATEVICPKCNGPVWDNRVGKKNPKAPDFKCKDKACDGVIWPPKNGKPPIAAKPPVSIASKPDDQLPEFLRDAAQEDAKELAEKIADKPTMHAAYKSLTQWVLAEIVPLYVKAEIGCSDTSVAAMTATLYISAVNRGKVE